MVNIFNLGNPGCPSCDGKRTVSFNWEGVLNGSNKEYIKYKKSLVEESALKRGWLYQCTKCKQNWYLDSDSKIMRIVEKSKLSLLQKWNQSKLSVSQETLERLKEISATPPDLYGNNKCYIKVPCKVTIKDGQEFDFAYISFQKTPPIEDHIKNVKFVDEILHIRKSEYALPKSVRFATTQAEEVRMGFAPTLVKSNDDNEFILNWTNDFFSYGNYKGQDISLSNKNYNMSNLPPIVYLPPEKYIYFIADWDEAFLSLRIETANKTVGDAPENVKSALWIADTKSQNSQ